MTGKSISTVLLVEDNPGDARLLREIFTEGSQGIKLIEVDCIGAAESYLAGSNVDIILLDLGLPDAQGLEGVRRARAAAPNVALVVLTGLEDESLANQALQEGAQDYLVKGQIEARGLLQELRCAKERQRLERLKDEFISSVSHELRTPLTCISASLGLLMTKGAATLATVDLSLLTIAHANSQRLVRLINDILDMGKLESGQVAFNFSRVDVRSLIEQEIAANRELAEGCGVRVRLEDISTSEEVRADPDRLAQVVTNLLANAVKFSPADNEVVISVERRGELVRVSVRDHGPGISVDFKSHIFERFAQADATNVRQKGGTGLGLSIVKQITDRLGGEVGFDDAPGGGTIFYVELPRWVRLGSVFDTDTQTTALRILICEDDPDTAMVLQAQLKDAGFAADIAYSADHAMTCAAATQYSAVLVDLLLPDGDGISLILRLRELPQHGVTPIIVVSVDPGRGRDDLRSRTLNVVGWLKKPVDMDRLTGLLASS